MAFLCAFTVAACGGGGGGAGAPQVTFQVTQVTPRDAAADVPLTEEINVVFSREVDPLSLSLESFKVIAESGDEVPGARLVASLNRSVVRFLPSAPYFPFAVHTIRVTTAVRDIDGDALDKQYEFVFQAEEAGPVMPKQSQVDDLGDLLHRGRWFHRMTLLNNNRFLITGGYQGDNLPVNQAENLIIPLEKSAIVASGMKRGRAAHVAVKLADGRVLIAGGEVSSDPFVPIADAEIFDTKSFEFELIAPMNVSRSFAHATRLNDGRVLVTGGQSVGSQGTVFFRDDAEIYDPAANTWTMVENRMTEARAGHFTGTLAGGDVVVIGGISTRPSADRWTAANGRFAQAFTGPSFPHLFGAGTQLPDGRLLVAGGLGTLGVSLYDPGFGFLGVVNRLADERTFATATAFADGRVLIVGGVDFGAVPALIHATVDLWFPIGQSGKIFRVTDIRLPNATTHHAAALGSDGAIWITGGLPQDAGLPGLRQVTRIRPEE